MKKPQLNDVGADLGPKEVRTRSIEAACKPSPYILPSFPVYSNIATLSTYHYYVDHTLTQAMDDFLFFVIVTILASIYYYQRQAKPKVIRRKKVAVIGGGTTHVGDLVAK